uniref:Kelch like family member 30 n=1 Tax=Hippocampus comes TaxID=109280 RepID=A0A3Q2Z0G9_HIPCM
MVRNVDDLDFCLPSHPQTILEGLRTLCSQPKMVDVTLSAGGRDFPCHRGVLALCSAYFGSMFSGDFVESIAARVELQEVDPDILGCLLDFAYTGKLTINQSNVEGLIRTSSRLQFQTVRAVCTRYLQHQIDATNCLGILEFGEIHGCPEVVAKARAFLLENFEAIQMSEEFLLQEKDRLVSCLSHDGLQIRCERTRVEAVLRWVGHWKEPRLAHMPELLGRCRLELLDRDYLRGTLMQDPLVQSSDGCREALEKVHMEASWKLSSLICLCGRLLDDDSDDDSDDEDGERARARERRAQPRNCAFYNTKTKQWHELPNFPNPNKWGFSMRSNKMSLSPVGGSRGSNTNTWSTTETWKYITKEGRWVTVAPMLRPRTNHSSATLNGEIYVIGGTTLTRVEVERYDPYHNTWTATCPAVKYVTNFTCTACQGKLYVIGSCAYNPLTMQCYNPVIDSWMSICSPFIPKYLSSPRSVCMEGNIYLLADNTKKVYSYDPDANMWQKIQLLHMLHENGGLVSLDGRLYVTGGHWKGMEGDYGVEVEVYNRASDTWEVEGVLPRLWFYSGVSTIFLDPSNWPHIFPADDT